MRERARGLVGLILFGGWLVLVAVPAAPARAADAQATATATFAGGCFWCMQPPFENLPGVVSTTVGYTGGTKKNPTYEEVSAGGTGHAESIQIVYDPQKVSYEKLLDIFWHNVDPLTADAQFCDRRPPVPHGDLHARRRAASARRSLEAAPRGLGPIQAADRHRDRRSRRVLSG